MPRLRPNPHALPREPSPIEEFFNGCADPNTLVGHGWRALHRDSWAAFPLSLHEYARLVAACAPPDDDAEGDD